MMNSRKTKSRRRIIAHDFNTYKVVIDKITYEFEELLEECKAACTIGRRNSFSTQPIGYPSHDTSIRETAIDIKPLDSLKGSIITRYLHQIKQTRATAFEIRGATHASITTQTTPG
ncbi:hypothetical protein HAX54_031971 [Datura stramonium]|uniref:Uncharacterized protein n=1 Tax=Datura stramonium TaxID=4076 RepID=A0ABS8VAF0_DATST|nr:hypothetical protein [Datura stramonium]